jgi:hypothetical protein
MRAEKSQFLKAIIALSILESCLMLDEYEKLDNEAKQMMVRKYGVTVKETLITYQNVDKHFKKLILYCYILTTVCAILYVANELGIPEKISSLFAGFFALIFLIAPICAVTIAIVGGLVFYLPLYLILGKTTWYKTAEDVSELIRKKEADQRSQIAAERRQREIEYHILATRYQEDFSTIENFFSKGDSIFMPKGRLSFPPAELAEVAKSWATYSKNKYANNETEKQKQIDYYRHITFLLNSVIDDEIAEAENFKAQLNELLSSNKISENSRDALTKDFALQQTKLNELKETKKYQKQDFLIEFDVFVAD